MKEWTESVQRMIDWIETHPDQNKVLENRGRDQGYRGQDPGHCREIRVFLTGSIVQAVPGAVRMYTGCVPAEAGPYSAADP